MRAAAGSCTSIRIIATTGWTMIARAAVIAHMAECAPCRRYDRVIRTGVAVLRDSLRKDPDALVDRGESLVDRWPFERGGYSRPAITGLTASATLLVIVLNVASGWSPAPWPGCA